ncbi:MAG: CHAT domain-containing protein [Deltaproteobacteria bacterium]|nr:CHAT domain-containing protein [Deltaproteobacteria bacterium]
MTSLRVVSRRVVGLAFVPVLALALAGAGCRRDPGAAPSPTGDRQLDARFAFARERDPALALRLGEALKCRAVGAALAAAGFRGEALAALREGRVPSLPALRPEEALLSLVVRGGELHRFLLVKGKVRALPARPLARIEAAVIGARDELELGEAERPEELFRRLRALDRELLEDATPVLEGVTQLVVLPDGLLRAVPFHALVQTLAPLRFVVEERAVSQAPCLGLLRPAAGLRQSAIALLPRYRGATEEFPLEGARDELASIERAGFRLQRVEGENATAERFERALGAPGGLVHFAGHGLPGFEAGRAPELVFAGGGRAVSVASLGAQPGAAAVAVLGACAAAYPARFRDGVRRVPSTSLVEGLLAGGTRAVLAASWTVKDRFSARLLAGFYRDLPRVGAGRALAAAQREWRRRLVPPHPRYWGAYALYGAWR